MSRAISAADRRRLISVLRWDWSNQFRQNMVSATILSTAALLAIALLAPSRPLAPEHTTLLLLIDPAAVGLGFVGAAIFLERSAGVIQAIGAAPSPLWIYVASKSLLFGGIGTAAGLLVAFAATDFWSQGGIGAAAATVAGLVLSNFCGALFGLGMATHARSMNGFLMRTGFASTPLALPPALMLIYGQDAAHPLIWLIPSAPMTYLFAIGGGAPGSAAGVVASTALLALWTALSWRFALRGLSGLLARGGA